MLYEAFLRDMAKRFAGFPYPVGWYVTPPDAWNELGALVNCDTRAARVLVQGEGDWTERQRQLFRTAHERDERRVVLIASDSPQLEADTVVEAFEALDRHDLVLGPTRDGGYYLIGMHGWHDVLRGVLMGTNTVLAEILARAEQSDLSVGQIEMTFDVDEAEDLFDLQRLAESRSDLAATRAALEAIGLLEPVGATR